jgi:hypothetical protein
MVFRNASRGQPAMEVFVLNLTNRPEASPSEKYSNNL